MKRDIVMFAMSRMREWKNGFANRNYHMYQQMLKQSDIGKIVVVDAPATTLKRAVRVFIEDILRADKKNARMRSWSTVLVEEIPGRVYRVSSILPLVSEQRFVQTMSRILETLEIHHPILWHYTPTYIKSFVALPASCRVFDAVDDWAAHASYHALRHRLDQNYALIQKHADAIFAVSDSLRAKFAGHPNVAWVPNGVDIARFGTGAHSSVLQNSKTPRIVYAGVIQQRFDVDLLAHAASARPQYQYCIVGWVWPDVDTSKLMKLPNVHFLGRVPYAEIPGILHDSSVGIVPHRRDALVESMNPLKIYEYLAAGLPVVTSSIPETGVDSAYVTESKNPEDFVKALDAWVTNAPDRGLVRKSVEHSDWSMRFGKMWSLIDSLLQQKS